MDQKNNLKPNGRDQMSKSIMKTKSFITAFSVIFCISASLFAQEQSDAAKKAEDEMKEAFGTVPVMMKVFPEHMRAAAWDLMKAQSSPDAALPAKYSELIALGVSSQIPCNYCIYAHTTRAKLFGATDEEIQEAIASAADTRHWSTVLNGAGVDFDEFKKEWDKILAYVKKQKTEKK